MRLYLYKGIKMVMCMTYVSPIQKTKRSKEIKSNFKKRILSFAAFAVCNLRGVVT